jgi:thiol-disulfide isomerase/thioredoxin
MYRCLLVFVLFGLAPLGAQSATKSYSCEAPESIRNAITQAGPGGIESLLAKYADDFWVLRTFIDSKGSSVPFLRNNSGIPAGPTDEAIIARFQREYQAKPKDPETAYLYAYSLIHRDTSKSVEILTSVVQDTPSFPPAWLSLAILHGYPNWDDRAKIRKYIDGYLARCPDSTESRVASLATQLDRSDTLIAYTKALRKRIAGKAEEDMISLYPSLWQLESKIALPAELAETKKRIEDDLQFLEGLDKTKFRQANIILMQGYQLTGNNEESARISKSITGMTSTSAQTTSFYQAQSEWARTNPLPAPTATQEERTAYYRKQIQFLDQWRDKMPQNTTLLIQRFSALALLPDTDEMLVREGGSLLVALRGQGSLIATSANAFDVLQVWAQRGLELDLIPSLVQELVAAQTRASTLTSSVQQSDLWGGSSQLLSNENRNWMANTNAWSILVTTHIKKLQFDQARSILAEWEKALNERRKKANEIREKQIERLRNVSASERSSAISNTVSSLESTIVSGISNDESRYYEGCAQLAAAEGRTLDALTYYQSFLRLMSGRNASPGFAELNAAKEAEMFWKKLGGSQSTWSLWMDSIKTRSPSFAPTPPPQQSGANRAIPKFSMTDLGGKTWTLDNLKGKTTLINVWATWCGPCREELPLLQQLYEQIQDRKDLQIITLNIDEDRSLVEPFLKKNTLSFPTLFASSFVKEFAGSIGIPTTWISDTIGTIRSEVRGFGRNNLSWIPQTLKQMESIGTAAK